MIEYGVENGLIEMFGLCILKCIIFITQNHNEGKQFNDFSSLQSCSFFPHLTLKRSYSICSSSDIVI